MAIGQELSTFARSHGAAWLALLILSLTWPAAIAVAADDAASAPPAASSPQAEELFELRVRPLLNARCFECHGAELAENDLRLDSRERLLRGGKHGSVVNLEKPAESRLLIAVGYGDDDLKMPPDGQLAAEDVQVLAQWIAAGAPWPAAKQSVAAGDHWAFQPIRQPPAPAETDPTWRLSPIDDFVIAGLRSHGLSPSARADRRTLIRRAAFDLTGLPPSAEEVAGYLADPRPEPEAFAEVVERYLASPRYGERWARHWLDIARFADTPGFSSAEIHLGVGDYPDAFTYRDYVIEAMNRDLPYDDFLSQQLAADLLPDSSHDLYVQRALGFLSVGRRDKRDVHEILDDRIDTVTRGLMGLTVQCARCHDHKTDPIPTEDYYSLYGVFGSVEEPQPYPALAIEATPEGRDFEQRAGPLQGAIDRHLSQQAAEFAALVRGRLADFLAATAHLDRSPGDSVQPEAARRQLPERVLTRFVRQWRQAATAPSLAPLMAPWNTWQALPAAPSVERRRAAIAELKAARPAIEPELLSALEADLPADLGALAAIYGRILPMVGAGEKPAKAGQGDSRGWREWLASEDSPLVFSGPAAADALDHAALKRLAQLESPLQELYATHPGAPGRAMVVRERSAPYDPRVFVRGMPENLGPPVPRRFLALLEGDRRSNYASGSGRREIAAAIVAPTNPLTARLIVNYVWLKHFGKALVATTNNFGLSGAAPSHPELLDHLAAQFMEQGWSLKQLHRALLNSAVYAQSSANRQSCKTLDPDNVWLWKYNSRSLDFECLRDALLQVSGQLDGRSGGRSVPPDRSAESKRRSLYLYADRIDFDPVQRMFNVPAPKTTVADRYQNIVPQQALFMMNSAQVMERAESLSRLPDFRAQGDPRRRIAWLYQRLLCRPPANEELRLALAFLQEEGQATGPVDPWAKLVHGLLMTNEFAFVE